MSVTEVRGPSPAIAQTQLTTGSIGGKDAAVGAPAERPAKHGSVFSAIKSFLSNIAAKFDNWQAKVETAKAEAKSDKLDATMTKAGRGLLTELSKPHPDVSTLNKLMTLARKSGDENYVETLTTKMTELTAGRTDTLRDGIKTAIDLVGQFQEQTVEDIADAEDRRPGMNTDLAAVRSAFILPAVQTLQAELSQMFASMPTSDQLKTQG
jgi:hypothetical protein